MERAAEQDLGSITQAATKAISSNYAKQRPLWVNLLDDVGSTDFYVVDGDSLLLDLVQSRRYSQGQFLQAVWMVESLLHNLSNCANSSFKVVFFQQHAALWQNSSQKLLRQVIMLHLQYKLPGKVLVNYTTWHSIEWKQYLVEVRANAAIYVNLYTQLAGEFPTCTLVLAV